jgi:hypothetical protein
MFILAVNSKLIYISPGQRILRRIQKMMITRHSDGNDGYTFFPGKADNSPFSEMIEFRVTTD